MVYRHHCSAILSITLDVTFRYSRYSYSCISSRVDSVTVLQFVAVAMESGEQGRNGIRQPVTAAVYMLLCEVRSTAYNLHTLFAMCYYCTCYPFHLGAPLFS
jgi:hypothetical protein